ncbi:MAG: hypothetical protein GX131_10030 [candidate division WS1 bacterium]|nr:hypothetical protein [candidate division WS1 bacterium]
MNFWDRLLALDRRYVFIGIALAVTIPIITALTLPLGEPAPPTVAVYEFIEGLEPGDVVMVAIDYSPSSMPELHPQAIALVRHALQKDLRVISVTLNPQGTALARDLMARVGAEVGAEDGVDYVHLGFKPGGSQVILGMGESIRQVYPTTADGRPTGTLPVMEGVNTYADIALLVDFAAGNLPFAWIAYAGERYNQDLAAGITAVMATDLYPYLQSGQLVGVINGLKGAAEYEVLLGVEGLQAPGMLGMSAQSIAHLLIIFLVIFGNIAYFASSRRRR